MIRIDEVLNGIDKLAITGHVHPDGDCVGSTLALYNYVKKNYPQINVSLFLEKPSEKLAFLKGFDEIISDYPVKDGFDLLIALDSASFDRIGKADKYFKKSKKTICIDHHVSNEGFADENIIVPDSSSASEVIYDLLFPDKLDRDIAICIYTGIVFDTGVFKYPSTSSKTMEIVSKLLMYDIPADYIIDNSFYLKTYNENRIMGYALINSKLAFDGKVIYSSISRKDMCDFDVTNNEIDGIVPQLRLTDGVVVAVFSYETAAGNIKFSLRSIDPFDVNKVACAFGGGGHVRASGCTLQGTLEDTMPKVLAEIAKYL